jgi:nitrogen fixation protein
MLGQKDVKSGVDELYNQLSAKGVKIDQKDLEDAVKVAREKMIVGCAQCANGWHW